MSVSKGLYGEKKEAMHLIADATSLADLKAETFRKKTEAVQNRQKGNYKPGRSVEGNKKTNIWSKENTGLLARMQRDMEVAAEEERNWQKSKSIMARKSRLYDSLKEGKGRSEIASNFLVKFEDKSESDSDSDDGRRRDRDYPARDEDEEWVEYTDALGRTRTCMRKDLKRLQRKDKDISRKEESRERSSSPEERDRRRSSDEEPDMLSEDMRREMLRQKWEKEELENLSKDALHYSDVRFDEARAHGAGFYAFSKDEEQRSKEQVTLKKLHEETDDARKEREKKAEKRKREMTERIRKIKQKRREKLGLPPIEDEPNNDDHKSDSDTESDFTKSVVEGLKMFRQTKEEEEKRRNEIKRRENLRDWDVGKEGLSEMKKEWKVMTQQEWLDKQRKERNAEFAPPTAFTEARNILQAKEEAYIKAHEMKRKTDKLNPKKNPFSSAAAPSKREGSVNQSERVPKTKLDPMAELNSVAGSAYPSSRSAGSSSRLDPMAELNNAATCSFTGSSNRLDPMAELNNTATSALTGSSSRLDPMATLDNRTPQQSRSRENKMTSYSTAMRIDIHRKMQEEGYLPPPGLNSRIINEVVEPPEADDDDDSDDDDVRGRGAEVAPPCSMDYFTSLQGPQRRGTNARSRDELTSAFNEGLRALKK